MRAALEALPAHRLVFATHPNPVAREPIERVFDGDPRARLVQSIDYPAFLRLQSDAELLVTDSGGIQEEGATLGVPVVVTREVTERQEGVAAGAVRLVGTDEDEIVAAVVELVTDGGARQAMTAASRELYGDGRSAHRIVDVLAAELG